MSTWYSMIPRYLELVKDFPDNGKDVKTSDKQIGVISEEHKRFYAMWQQMSREAALEEVELNYETDEEKRKERQGRVYELKTKAQALLILMWVAINDDMETWPMANLQIRKGWLLVQGKPPKMPRFPGFIFGQPQDDDE